jgi:hypothetical protein
MMASYAALDSAEATGGEDSEEEAGMTEVLRTMLPKYGGGPLFAWMLGADVTRMAQRYDYFNRDFHNLPSTGAQAKSKGGQLKKDWKRRQDFFAQWWNLFFYPSGEQRFTFGKISAKLLKRMVTIVNSL